MKIREYFDRGELERVVDDPLAALPKVKDYENNYGMNNWLKRYINVNCGQWCDTIQSGSYLATPLYDNAKEEREDGRN